MSCRYHHLPGLVPVTHPLAEYGLLPWFPDALHSVLTLYPCLPWHTRPLDDAHTTSIPTKLVPIPCAL